MDFINYYAYVHVAINKYVLPQLVPDVADAVQHLITDDVEAHADKRVFADSNWFRREFCYLEEVDTVLRRHEVALRQVFSAVASTESADVSKAHLTNLIDFNEWKALLRALNLLGADLTERDGTLCFTHARMVVIDSWSMRGAVKEVNLPFEGFLEAIVRLATLKALPTDEEVAASCLPDAGAYFRRMRRIHENHYHELMRTRGNQWPGELRQPIWRCVDHLISIMIRAIQREGSSSAAQRGPDELVITPGELEEFIAQHRLAHGK